VNKRKKRRRNRVQKRERQPMKPACAVFLAQLADLRNLARDHLLTIECRGMKCAGPWNETLHVMFNDADGSRVLNYWPGTGRTWDGKNKNTAADGAMALDMAAEIASREGRYAEEVESHMAAITGR
jgi:hypothetical protein